MGNQLAKPGSTRPAELLSDLPNVVHKDTLGASRLLKTFQCVHDDGGLVVVKVYIKREDSPYLEVYKQRLEELRTKLSGIECSHVWPFQHFLETDQKAFLVRQYLFSNLYERISTRPFLSFPEKKWITFQLLYALAQAHERNICHGDIKCENVLITSWNWIYLSDFASFKPTFLPADNPADFSFFFDTGGSRRCYLAPERFVDGVSYIEGADPSRRLEPTMDIFSMGCVLGELFLEGKALFNLSQLHAYKRGEYDPTPVVSKIDSAPVRKLILHMIQLDPGRRHASAQDYLREWGGDVFFPPYIARTLHPFYASLLYLDSDARLAGVQSAYEKLKQCIAANEAIGQRPDKGGEDASAGSGQDDFVQGREEQGGKTKEPNTLIEDAKALHDELVSKLDSDATGQSQSDAAANSGDDKQRKESTEQAGEGTSEFETCEAERLKEGMMITVSLFCSLLRNTKAAASKCVGIDLLCKTGLLCEDETKLQHVVPYLIEMISQSSSLVRSIALRTLTKIIDSVQHFPDSEVKMFSEYIFPSLTLLCSDADDIVKVQFANELPMLVSNAHRLLGTLGDLGSTDNARKGSRSSPSSSVTAPAQKMSTEKLESELYILRKEVSRILIELTTGSHASCMTIQAILHQFSSFCVFFGEQETNNFLLPLLITFLNQNDWRVRKEFFVQVPDVGEYVGARALETFLLPCIEQALVDPENEVVSIVLISLSEMAKRKLLRKSILLSLVDKSRTLLFHTFPSIHLATVKFISSVASIMAQIDIYAHLLPKLSDVWKVECPNLRDEACILECLKDSKSDHHRSPHPNRGPSGARSGGNVSSTLSAATPTQGSHLTPSHYSHDSRVSPGMAVYSVPRADFIRTPEQSLHSAIRTGSLQTKDWKKLVSPPDSLSLRKDATATTSNGGGTSGVGASVSILDQSSLFMAAKSPQYHQQHPDHHQKHQRQRSLDAQKNLSDAVVDALSTGVSAKVSFHSSLQAAATWQPRGVLISHLPEHRRAVNKLCVGSPEGLFFASASDDGTVKVWDSRKLEKDVTFKSRLTYSAQGGRILSLASMKTLDNTMASASSDGSVHIWNVEYAVRGGVVERYTCTNKLGHASPSEGSVLSLASCGHLVLYVTQEGTIHAYDHRQSRDAWTLACKQSHGVIRHMVLEPNDNAWLATASDYGVMSIFDLRFLLCAKQWSHPSESGINAMVLYRDNTNQGQSSKSQVLISAGQHETALWDVFDGRCEHIFRNLGRGESGYTQKPISSVKSSPVSDLSLSKLDADVNTVNEHLKADQLEKPPLQWSGHRTILPLPVGAFLTGGSDCFVRFWHPTRFEQSYVVCGPVKGMDGVQSSPFYFKKQPYCHIPTVEEVKPEQAADQASKSTKPGGNLVGSSACHEDCILDLALLSEAHEQIILSCSRDGVVKAWK